jgi:light-regulated signal transduction histidine kinase (bacteriophytochrome)
VKYFLANILIKGKLEAGKLEICKECVNLKQIVKEIKKMNEQKVKEKELFFKCDIDEDLPDLLETDKARIIQVLMNLIGNSIKFTSKGGVFIKINWVPTSSFGNEDEKMEIMLNDLLNISERKKFLNTLHFPQRKQKSEEKKMGFRYGIGPKCICISFHECNKCFDRFTRRDRDKLE